MSLMKKILFIVPLILFSASISLAEPDVSADTPPQWVPLGVYLSWEIPSRLAKYNQVDRWEFISGNLDLCVENSIDTLWVTNMPEKDLPRLIKECERRNLKLLVSMGAIEVKIKDRWAAGSTHYERVIPRIVKLAGDSKTLVGWVLSDEPKEEDLEHLEQVRKMFREHDPDRICLTVAMPRQAPLIPEQTDLPVVCVDLYPFFGPDDPNGPHTDATSQAYLRKNAQLMADAIGDKNMVGWVMGQSFVEIWGPHIYNKKGHAIAMPGAYLHWRSPTVAEIRWQVWETFRSRCKGFFIFQLAPVPFAGPKTAQKKIPDVPWKDALVKKPTNAGPAGLTTPQGKATPQLKELGVVYKSIAPYRPMIRRWKAAASPLVVVPKEGDASIQCFIDPLTQRYFCVIVNDDLHRSRDIAIHVQAESAIELIRGESIPLKPLNKKSPFRQGTVVLPPGGGTIIELKTGM